MTIKYSFSNVELKVGGKVVGFVKSISYESAPEPTRRQRRRRKAAQQLGPEQSTAGIEKAQADWFDKVWSTKRPKKSEGR